MKIGELLFGHRFPRGREADTMLVVAALVAGTTLGGGLLAAVARTVFQVPQESLTTTGAYGITASTCLYLIVRRHHVVRALWVGVAAALFYVALCTFKPNIAYIGFMTFCYLVCLRLYAEGIKPEKPKLDRRR